MYINSQSEVISANPITAIKELHEHLQVAIELEFSTLPPYLCALYSIKEGTNIYASKIIRSVVMEEMFHFANAANVLIGTGGSPKINKKEFLPCYPTKLPDNEDWFEVNLLPFSCRSLETFLYIEHPHFDRHPKKITIGDFYAKIEDGLIYLHKNLGDELFPQSHHESQVPDKYYYGGEGIIKPVTDIKSAMFALNAIIEQGEGMPEKKIDPTRPFPITEPTDIESGDKKLFGESVELAHYYRFNELYVGRRYKSGDSPESGPTGAQIPINFNEVYDMKPNPKESDYSEHPELKKMNNDFVTILSQLLDQLHCAFNGNPELMEKAVITMYSMKEVAQQLMRNPIPGTGYNAGPTWTYIPSAIEKNYYSDRNK